jgi:hypothetical protein
MTVLNTLPLETFLRETIGLASDSLGRGTLGRAAQRQMDAVGCDRVGDYVTRLRGDERLRQQLIEELVVPETWFFATGNPSRCWRGSPPVGSGRCACSACRARQGRSLIHSP